MFSFSGSSRPRLLELRDTKDEGTAILQNMGIYSPDDVVSHRRRFEYLSALQCHHVCVYTYSILRITKQILRKPQI